MVDFLNGYGVVDFLKVISCSLVFGRVFCCGLSVGVWFLFLLIMFKLVRIWCWVLVYFLSMLVVVISIMDRVINLVVEFSFEERFRVLL